jgi:tRNA pseudouridine55 synthase
VGVGPYSDMIDFATLEDAAQHGLETLDKLLTPMDTMLTNWPELIVSKDSVLYLRQGHAVQIPHAPPSGWVKLFAAESHQFLGVGQILEDGRVTPKRVLNL